jgi:hypothetical protein
MLHMNKRGTEAEVLFSLLDTMAKTHYLKSLYWYSGYVFCSVNDYSKYSKENVDNVMTLCEAIVSFKEKQIKQNWNF